MLSCPEGDGQHRSPSILLNFNHNISMKVQEGAYWEKEFVATDSSILEGHLRSVGFIL